MAQPGYFQYDRGKWGFVNKQGNVDFGAKAPGKGANIHAMSRVSPWLKKTGKDEGMPQQRGYLDDWRKDFHYTKRLESLMHQRKMHSLPLKHQQQMMRSEYDDQKPQLDEAWQKNMARMNASAAARGILSSGMQDNNAADLNLQHSRDADMLEARYGNEARSRIGEQLAELARGFKIDKQMLGHDAKQAWKNKVDAGEVKIPDKGYFKKNGIWHFRNRDGVEVSLGAKPTKHTPGLAEYLRKRGK